MAPRDVFIIGPGFIGWALLDLLVKEGYSCAALVRRREHGEQIKETGALNYVVGDLHDKELIAGQVAKHSIIFHTATADDLPSAEAVLDGIKRRANEGKSTLFIHTSGTSVLDDKSRGEFKGEKIYTDTDRASIDALPDNAPHREIDLAIVKAQKELGDKAKIAIMIPPEIYGYNHWNQRLTIQVPAITNFALKHGYAGYVGKGLGIESQIHVNDLAQGYMTLLHHMELNPPEVVLNNPYFFCENGLEFSWLEVATEVAKGLHQAGKLKDPNPKPFDKSQYDDLFGDFTDAVIGLNSRSRAARLRDLGWKPTHKTIWESFHQDELPAILARAS